MNEVYIRCDGTRLSIKDLAETIPLHWRELEELAESIGLCHAWLGHTGENVRNDLEAFLWGGGHRIHPAEMVEQLGDMLDRLNRLIDATRPEPRF